MEELLARHRAGDVTARLNRVYAEEPSALDASLASAQARSADLGGW